MIRQLSYNQKMIALSLMQKCSFADAAHIFGSTFEFSNKDTSETLTYLLRTAIVVHGVIVEKQGIAFFVFGKEGERDTSAPLDEAFLSNCLPYRRRSFEKTMEILKERKFSSAA